ncbi:MAG: RNA 2',3'-cyclic phosphodiesterase [Spirochaetales bacterium]|nr:RNA 2',3'-cyclic phosphodiesterase [Spirochaetales bacterium]
MYRLFIAVPIPSQIKRNLLQLRSNIPGAKWTLDDQFHITLKFIGEVDGQVFSDIRNKLSEIIMDKFLLQIKGVGYFASGKLPKSLWAGLEESQQLIRLKNKLERSLYLCGINREGRKFRPHVTLARLKNIQINSVSNFLFSNDNFTTENFIIDEFRLYSSKLYPHGAVHNIEAVYSLE